MRDGEVRVYSVVPERREWSVPAGRQVQHILSDLGFEAGAVLVIRGEELLTPDDAPAAGDAIEVRPVISGG